jgi:hypothetical protein
MITPHKAKELIDGVDGNALGRKSPATQTFASPESPPPPPPAGVAFRPASDGKRKWTNSVALSFKRVHFIQIRNARPFSFRSVDTSALDARKRQHSGKAAVNASSPPGGTWC